MTPRPRPSRALCLWLVGISGVVFVVLCAVLIPWSWVPGGHPLHVQPSEVFSETQLRRSETYSTMQRHLRWAALAVSLAVAVVLGLTRLGARLVRLLPGPWWVKAVLGTLAVLLVGELATAPFDLAVRANALEYGLTRQSLGGWLRDRAFSLLVSWVFSGITVLVVLVAGRRSPRRWPLYAAAVGALLTVLGSWVYPLLVEPLFNQFTSLSKGDLRSQIFTLADKEKVPISDVLVADASRRTTTLNAYVSGIGSTRRVVLYDNLVEDVPERETLTVVAHELGHARHHDVAKGTLLGATGVVLGSGLLGLVLSRRPLLDRAGVQDAGQPEVVPLLLALMAMGAILVSPVQNTLSRAVEARADRASLEATGDYAGFERMQVQLATRSLSDVDPPWLSQFWFGSHPTALQRIGMARALERGER